MIAAIVAVDNNWGIGYKGELLEKIPEDLNYFKELTTGHTVVMGSKTWESLPCKPLPNRTNIVLTYSGNSIKDKNTIFLSLNDLLLDLDSFKDDIYVIGGGQIYKQMLPYCDRVYLTKIYTNHENVDTYFPNLDEMDEWTPAMSSFVFEHEGLSYQFWEYDKVS